MNSLTRRHPFKKMEGLQSRMTRLLGLALARVTNGHEESTTLSAWAPPVDITEDDQEWVMRAELPEVKKQDVKVAIENGVLTITGERKCEKEEKAQKYHRLSYGTFLRSFMLPDTADRSRATAEFRDDVLNVRLPKSEKAKPKAVEVTVT